MVLPPVDDTVGGKRSQRSPRTESNVSGETDPQGRRYPFPPRAAVFPLGRTSEQPSPSIQGHANCEHKAANRSRGSLAHPRSLVRIDPGLGCTTGPPNLESSEIQSS